MNVRLNADGEIDTSASTGIRSVSDLTGDNVPVSYPDYQEKYFFHQAMMQISGRKSISLIRQAKTPEPTRYR